MKKIKKYARIIFAIILTAIYLIFACIGIFIIEPFGFLIIAFAKLIEFQPKMALNELKEIKRVYTEFKF